MNRQIARLAVTSLALVIALIVATTYWQTWAAPGLAARQDNAIKVVAQFTIDRGDIFAGDGKTPLARNEQKKVKGKTFYFREYPAGPLAPHAVGYSTQARNRAGIERAQNDYLTASNANLATVLDKLSSDFRGATIEGNDLQLTLDVRAQRIANGLLRGKCGAVVALDPTTGRVLALASAPTYDPNLVESKNGYKRILAVGDECGRGSALLNRATDGLYAPGSTFKVVTAAAALDTGKYTPESTFRDPGYCIQYGKRVYNYADQGTPSGYGTVNFVQAMENSINSVFCNIGKELGADVILDYAKSFGFYSRPPLDVPENETSASGLYDGERKLFRPKDPNKVDAGRLAFGQERLLTTPVQMAMVAATVANDGRMMQPYLVDRVISPDRKTVMKRKPKVIARPIKRETANELEVMMRRVVESGTATNAQISGMTIGGKTGTAETGVRGRNTTWFIAFGGPREGRPRVAIAVVLERQSGTGGQTAAPIARAVMQAILRPRGRGSGANP